MYIVTTKHGTRKAIYKTLIEAKAKAESIGKGACVIETGDRPCEDKTVYMAK